MNLRISEKGKSDGNNCYRNPCTYVCLFVPILGKIVRLYLCTRGDRLHCNHNCSIVSLLESFLGNLMKQIVLRHLRLIVQTQHPVIVPMFDLPTGLGLLCRRDSIRRCKTWSKVPQYHFAVPADICAMCTLHGNAHLPLSAA